MTPRPGVYETLRFALYGLVASGALALSLVEGHGWWLLVVAVAALLAHLTVDRGRWPALHPNLGSLLALGLLGLYLLGLWRGDGLKPAVLMTARLFVCVQLILFFSPFRPSMTWIFFASSLLVLLLSGLLLPGVSLLARLLVFLVALGQALLLHALFRGLLGHLRQRARFLGRHASEASGVLEGEDDDDGRSGVLGAPIGGLTPRLARQGLGIALGAAPLCLLFTLLLFFFWPRLPRLGADPRAEPEAAEERGSPLPDSGLNEAFAERARTIGFSRELSLAELGPLQADPTPALRLRCDRPLDELASPSGHLYLRGLAFARYAVDRWQPERPSAIALLGGDVYVEMPASPHFVAPPGAVQVALEVEPLLATGPVLFSLANVRRLRPPGRAHDRALIDVEGMLAAALDLEPFDPLSSYEVHSYTPVHADALPGDTRRELPERARRYVALGTERARLRTLALEVVGDATGHLEQARRLRDFLAASGRYRYTRFLDTLDHGADKVGDFLFDPDPAQRSGHCGYFATAMVMLARSLGLPARVAIGFACPVRGLGRELEVQSSWAHAWAELYFEEVGWLVFEATPPASAEELPPPPELAEEGTVERGAEGAGPDSLAADAPASPEGEEEREAWSYVLDFDRDDQAALYGSLLEGGGGALLLAALLGLLGWALWRFLARRRPALERFVSLPPRARGAVRFYARLLKALAAHGIRRRAGQTPRELAAAAVAQDEALRPALAVTALFERVRYGEEDLAPAERARLEKALRRLEAVPVGG